MNKLQQWVMLIAIFLLFPNSSWAAVPVEQRSRDYYESHGSVIWEVPTEEKVIALTFDDGPDPKQTPMILDLLKQYDAKATFFVVGEQLQLYPEIGKREVREGHEIGNHTYTHRYFSKRSSAELIEKEIKDNEKVIKSIIGQNTFLFRPPAGFYNDTLVNVCSKNSFLVIMWSWHQDTKDWRNPGVNKIVNKVLGNARNGDIVLMHDHVEGGRYQTVEALKQILPELTRRGYKLITVSDLLTYNKHLFPVERLPAEHPTHKKSSN
ncbi:polysaccharide deacetylase family protein [Paenibacillus sediminis]|uniref:Polysaccharide deacetylase family sporulation protein PdaB n=1 Tax=Paenibacillus sediminis TaxID=664909 RepID=A0ABS4H1D1_9BACL|nr:polysaccharide deacetylase family protein [Paenibacillus sediminis]MBP1936276.1 polysaccharide deacetylase family sporulation protein PdaB [Paenibacillus sediminis]